jgi:hypothetical protein
MVSRLTSPQSKRRLLFGGVVVTAFAGGFGLADYWKGEEQKRKETALEEMKKSLRRCYESKIKCTTPAGYRENREYMM